MIIVDNNLINNNDFPILKEILQISYIYCQIATATLVYFSTTKNKTA